MKCGYDLLSIFYGKSPIRTIHNQNQTVHNWTISDQTIYSIFEFPVIFFLGNKIDWKCQTVENTFGKSAILIPIVFKLNVAKEIISDKMDSFTIVHSDSTNWHSPVSKIHDAMGERSKSNLQ